MPYPLPSGQEAWQYKIVQNLKGLNTEARENNIDDPFFITANNVLNKKKVILQDTGYKSFANQVEGIPQATYQMVKSSGLDEVLLLTTKCLYRYSQSLGVWEMVVGDTSTTTTAGASAGATQLTVVSSTGFADTNLMFVTLSDGSQHQTKVNGTPPDGTHINILDAIPAGKSVSNGAVVAKGPQLNGTIDNQPSMVVLPSHNWFVFTNQVDIVKRYDGTDCINVPNLPSSGNTTCVAVASYNAALFLLGTTEGGTPFPQRVRRSDVGDPTNWTTNTAGWDDLYDLPDKILCADILGPYLIIYRDRSITRGQYVGTGGKYYDYTTVVTAEGVLSGESLINLGDYHVFAGRGNIYEYRGGYDIEPIGNQIFYRMYSTDGDLDPSNVHKTFGFYVEELDEIWIFYRSTLATTDGCDTLLRYNISEDCWYTRKFAHEFVGFGFHNQSIALTWNTLEGSWLDQTWKWADRNLEADAPTTHLCCATLLNGKSQLFEYDYFTPLDNSAAIAYTVETKDFELPDQNLRFDMLEMGIAGTNVLVEISVDGGNNWQTLGTITSSQYSRQRLFKQIVSNRVRFRWSGSVSGFRLDWYGFSYKAESIF